MSKKASFETIKSPEQRISPETLELVEKLKIKEQWEEQVRTLNETGILELLPKSQDIGIVDINGKEQPIPTYEQILKYLDNKEQQEIIKQKLEQGFTKMLLVPMGLPISIILDRYKRLVVKKHQEGKLLSTDGEKLELNQEEPIWVNDDFKNADTEGKLIYFPEKFDRQDHQGKTKQELIDQQEAWQILLIEDLPDLPAQGKGGTVGSPSTALGVRKQLEANQSPEQYLKIIQTDKSRQHEQASTIESELIYALSELKNRNKQIDDWQGKGKISWLFGNLLPEQGSSSGVPDFSWNRGFRQAVLSWAYPDRRGEGSGARSGVKILKK